MGGQSDDDDDDSQGGGSSSGGESIDLGLHDSGDDDVDDYI